MRIDGATAMIALDNDASLRVEPGMPLEITCAGGVLWVTQEGDVRDLFLAPGDCLRLAARGVTIVTALESSMVHVAERAWATEVRGGWRRVLRWLHVAAGALPRPRVILPRVPILKR